MTSGKGKGLEAFADAHDQARFTENQEIARTNRTLRARVEEQAAELAEVRRKLDLIDAVSQVKVAPPKWLLERPKDSKHHGIPSLMLTDFHWGAVIRPEEIDGINAYNVAIAEMRLKQACRRTIRVAREYMAGVTYDGIQVFLGGDLFSGTIHDELRETNALTTAESIMSLIEPLEAGLNLLADAFGKVHVLAVPGNHSRATMKPRAKRRAHDNFDWLVCQMLRRDYKKDTRITVEVSDAPDARVTLYNTRYLLTHGDQFKGGSGISSAMAPLLLGVHRKTRREAAVGRTHDIMVMGHFHQTLMLPSKGLIVGGALMGYDEYAYLNNFEPEPPQQAFWITTPEHGVTLAAPIFVQDRILEGW